MTTLRDVEVGELRDVGKGVLAWKIGQCLYLWLRIGGVLSDIDTELMEVCYWGEGQEVGWKKL